MSNNPENPQLSKSEIEIPEQMRDRINFGLLNLGFDEALVRQFEIKPVDDFHRNCLEICAPTNQGGEPIFIAKFLDPLLGYDVDEDSVRREHAIGQYASGVVPELKARKLSGWFGATAVSPALVLYDYLGQAATNITGVEETMSIVHDLMPIIVNLHTRTASTYFGQNLNEAQAATRTTPTGIGASITKFLLNDIRRGNMDTSGEIENLIRNRWIPLLDQLNKFSLCHQDITLSNIIIKEGRVNSLIDWTHGGWSDPTNDLSYLFFWALIRGGRQDVESLFESAKQVYSDIGLHPEATMPFYLAFKSIEYGRFKGEKWVEMGRELLKCNSAEEAFSLLDSTKSL